MDAFCEPKIRAALDTNITAVSIFCMDRRYICCIFGLAFIEQL